MKEAKRSKKSKAACLLYLVAKEEACEGDGLVPVVEAVVRSEPSEVEAGLLQQCVEQVAPVGLLVARTCGHDDDDMSQEDEEEDEGDEENGEEEKAKAQRPACGG